MVYSARSGGGICCLYVHNRARQWRSFSLDTQGDCVDFVGDFDSLPSALVSNAEIFLQNGQKNEKIYEKAIEKTKKNIV